MAAAGLRLRSLAWSTTSDIRFNADIANGFHWGGEVNNVARQANGGVEPSFSQLVRAEDQVYRDLVQSSDPSNYELDYPAGRLLTMSLWRRAVRRQFPSLDHWVQRSHDLISDNHGATEEIATPVLTFNTCNEAAAAILAALLVGVWVRRSATRSSIVRAGGVLAFIVCSSALFYGLYVASLPAPAPPPSLALNAPPTVSPKSAGQADTTIFVTVNSQGAPAQVYVEWGNAEGSYPHRSETQMAEGETAADLSIDLHDLPAKQQIHYRVVARNDLQDSPHEFGRGTTRTGDSVFITDAVTQPAPPRETFGAVWLSLEQWAGLGIVLIAMLWSLRRMETPHRAWGTAMLAGGLIWINPCVLVDGPRLAPMGLLGAAPISPGGPARIV